MDKDNILACITCIELKAKSFFIIHYEEEERTCFVGCEPDSYIASFLTREAAEQYVYSQGFKSVVYLGETPVNFLKNGKVDCSQIINLWNLCSDIATSLGLVFLGDYLVDPFERLYQKVFSGCNLPSISDNTAPYNPIWTNQELVVLALVFSSCLSILSEAVDSDVNAEMGTYADIRRTFLLHNNDCACQGYEIVSLKKEANFAYNLPLILDEQDSFFFSLDDSIVFSQRAEDLLSIMEKEGIPFSGNIVEVGWPDNIHDAFQNDFFFYIAKIARSCGLTFLAEIPAYPFIETGKSILSSQPINGWNTSEESVFEYLMDDADCILNLVFSGRSQTTKHSRQNHYSGYFEEIIVNRDYITDIVNRGKTAAKKNGRHFLGDEAIPAVNRVLSLLKESRLSADYYDRPEWDYMILAAVVRSAFKMLDDNECFATVENDKDSFKCDVNTKRHGYIIKALDMYATEFINLWYRCERLSYQKGIPFIGCERRGSVGRLKIHICRIIDNEEFPPLSDFEEQIVKVVYKDICCVIEQQGDKDFD